jgi:hypothetical protein
MATQEASLSSNVDSNAKIYTILRWDAFLDLAKWGISLTALVFASLSIESYIKLPPKHECFKHDLANFYIPFISSVIILFTLMIITPYQFARILELAIPILIPPTILVLTSLLIYWTNGLAHESVKQLIE